VASCLSRDAEEGRKRVTNEEIRDIIDDGIFHEFNKGYTHKGGGVQYANMREPRPCSYEELGTTTQIVEPISHQISPNGYVYITTMPS
jgi:hypothetical protein